LRVQHVDVPAMEVANEIRGAAEIQQTPQWDEIDLNALLLQVPSRGISLPDLERADTHIEASPAERRRRQAQELFRAAHSEPIDHEKNTAAVWPRLLSTSCPSARD
jgi:hypothetical protein